MSGHRAKHAICCSFFAALIASLSTASATSVLQASIEQMASDCDLVFEGQVVKVESRRIPNRPGIYTYVTFDVQDVVTGTYQGSTIELRFLGGTAGGMTLTVSEMRIPKPGEKGIYFVESLSRAQIHPLYGWSQGHFVLIRDSEGIERVVTARQTAVTAISRTREIIVGQQFSGGVASGVIEEPDPTSVNGLTKAEFKQSIRDMVRTAPR